MDDQELRDTADLAHLNLNDAEIKQFAEAVSHMLDYFSIINEIDVSAYEAKPYLQHTVSLRPDVVEPNSTPDLIENAAENEDGYVILPNIL